MHRLQLLKLRKLLDTIKEHFSTAKLTDRAFEMEVVFWRRQTCPV